MFFPFFFDAAELRTSATKNNRVIVILSSTETAKVRQSIVLLVIKTLINIIITIVIIDIYKYIYIYIHLTPKPPLFIT